MEKENKEQQAKKAILHFKQWNSVLEKIIQQQLCQQKVAQWSKKKKKNENQQGNKKNEAQQRI